MNLGIALSLFTAGIHKGLAKESHARFPSEKESHWEKGFVRFGGFAAALNSNLGFGFDGGPSVEIDEEGAFGLDSSLTVLQLFRVVSQDLGGL